VSSNLTHQKIDDDGYQNVIPSVLKPESRINGHIVLHAVCIFFCLLLLTYLAISTLFENFRSLKVSSVAEIEEDKNERRQVSLSENMEIVEKIGE